LDSNAILYALFDSIKISAISLKIIEPALLRKADGFALEENREEKAHFTPFLG
jgi:hypothetical protein